jgi:hemolysin activation/secretion protein
MSAEQLAPAVAAYLNRPLDFNQLQAAVTAVAEFYRAAGWVVRAYLPQQDIQDGNVTIQIVEAVFGQIKREGTVGGRVSVAQVDAIFLAQQKSGDVLNADALDRALLLGDDLPGIILAGSLVAGASDRETDLILKTADEPLVIGEIAADNTGSRSTGDQRLTANLSLASPAGWGDLGSANLINTRGSDYGRLAYSIPVGSDGWRIGVSASELRYQLIQAPQTLQPTEATQASSGSMPVIR